MPQEIAATLSRSTLLLLIMLRVFIQPMQSASATQAPVMEAVRVPPSAWITSQSTVIWRSPSASRSTVARNERPIRRWISTVRPFCLPADASRRVLSRVARGRMPYSAVTQPRPWPLSHGGSRSSSVAVTSTWVSPNLTMQEPSAYLTTPRSSETARSSSGARRLGRMENPPKIQERLWLAVLVGGGTGSGKALCRHFPTHVCLYLARQMDKLGPLAIAAGKVASGFASRRDKMFWSTCGPPRTDRPDRAARRASPAQRALAGHLSSNR